MQVYEGLDNVTNKITEEEQRSVAHHLLGGDSGGAHTVEELRDHHGARPRHQLLPCFISLSIAF